MTATWCPRCGVTWDQHGNQTGHCSQCHETFGNLTAFDAHQRIWGGRGVCLDPATLRNRKTSEAKFMTIPDRFGTPVWRSARTWDGPDGQNTPNEGEAKRFGRDEQAEGYPR